MSITPIGNMDISLSASDSRTMNAIDISMLKKALDTVEVNGDMITQMMEQSVNPNIGTNIDVRV